MIRGVDLLPMVKSLLLEMWLGIPGLGFHTLPCLLLLPWVDLIQCRWAFPTQTLLSQDSTLVEEQVRSLHKDYIQRDYNPWPSLMLVIRLLSAVHPQIHQGKDVGRPPNISLALLDE